jgi:hypothetical protein
MAVARRKQAMRGDIYIKGKGLEYKNTRTIVGKISVGST